MKTTTKTSASSKNQNLHLHLHLHPPQPTIQISQISTNSPETKMGAVVVDGGGGGRWGRWWQPQSSASFIVSVRLMKILQIQSQ
ncbi:hypothetical protein Hdeb2414_s0018g00514401 [Helianthus debilis subsp. tardiflorus]